MFWRKKEEPTLTEQAVSAVDRVTREANDLYGERCAALESFRGTAEWLASINEELCQKIDLCETLTSQLRDAMGSMGKQVADNDRVREKILNIIGE